MGSEKYYDCLQCGEDCRHVVSNSRKHSGGIRQSSTAPNLLLSVTPVNSKTNSRPSMFLTRKLPQTPAKKRSSLARPVRVHDSFGQPKIIANYYQQPNNAQADNAYNNIESNETQWPARIRLEEIIDYDYNSLPHSQIKDNCKRTFKDTDKLLKVMSINNVDQDLDSVKRCSVM